MVIFRSSPMTSKDNQITAQQFKEWLKSIDQDGDGKINMQELRGALRALGFSCARWKAWRALVHADLNNNKLIDGEDEAEELIKYAAKSWGIDVVEVKELT